MAISSSCFMIVAFNCLISSYTALSIVLICEVAERAYFYCKAVGKLGFPGVVLDVFPPLVFKEVGVGAATACYI